MLLRLRHNIPPFLCLYILSYVRQHDQQILDLNDDESDDEDTTHIL